MQGLSLLHALQQRRLPVLYSLHALLAQCALLLLLEESAAHADEPHPPNCTVLPATHALEIYLAHQAAREGQRGLLHHSTQVRIVDWVGR